MYFDPESPEFGAKNNVTAVVRATNTFSILRSSHIREAQSKWPDTRHVLETLKPPPPPKKKHSLTTIRTPSRRTPPIVPPPNREKLSCDLDNFARFLWHIQPFCTPQSAWARVGSSRCMFRGAVFQRASVECHLWSCYPKMFRTTWGENIWRNILRPWSHKLCCMLFVLKHVYQFIFICSPERIFNWFIVEGATLSHCGHCKLHSIIDQTWSALVGLWTLEVAPWHCSHKWRIKKWRSSVPVDAQRYHERPSGQDRGMHTGCGRWEQFITQTAA